MWHFFSTHAIGALFLLILIEEAGIPLPVPGDTLLFLAASQPHASAAYRIALILAASLAAIIGSSLLFNIMHRAGRPLLLKYGKFLHLSPQRLAKMEAWFGRRGWVALLGGRLIPGLRIPTTVMAGCSGLPYREYLKYGSVAAVMWSAIFVLLGSFFSRGIWQLTGTITSDVFEYFPRWLVVGAVLLAV